MSSPPPSDRPAAQPMINVPVIRDGAEMLAFVCFVLGLYAIIALGIALSMWGSHTGRFATGSQTWLAWWAISAIIAASGAMTAAIGRAVLRYLADSFSD